MRSSTRLTAAVLQSSLLRYWNFTPEIDDKPKDDPKRDSTQPLVSPLKGPESREAEVTNKKTPVFFLDEAHKL